MKVGTCSCSANYIGETKKTMSRHSRMNYKDPNKDSEAAKHLRDFLDHKVHQKILFMAPANAKLHAILESLIIAIKRPGLSEQLDFDQLILFRNGDTQLFYNLIAEFILINTYVSFANLPICLLLQNFVFTSEDLVTVYTL